MGTQALRHSIRLRDLLSCTGLLKCVDDIMICMIELIQNRDMDARYQSHIVLLGWPRDIQSTYYLKPALT